MFKINNTNKNNKINNETNNKVNNKINNKNMLVFQNKNESKSELIQVYRQINFEYFCSIIFFLIGIFIYQNYLETYIIFLPNLVSCIGASIITGWYAVNDSIYKNY